MALISAGSINKDKLDVNGNALSSGSITVSRTASIPGDILNTGKIDINQLKLGGKHILNTDIITLKVLCAPQLESYSGPGQLNADVAFITDKFQVPANNFKITELYLIDFNTNLETNNCDTLIAQLEQKQEL